MKTRNYVLLAVVGIIIISVLMAINYSGDKTIQNLLIEITIDSNYNRDPARVLDHCAQQKYGEENNWKTPDGKNFAVTSIGLYTINKTHYIDNNICTWIERPVGVNQMLTIKEVKEYLEKIENED